MTLGRDSENHQLPGPIRFQPTRPGLVPARYENDLAERIVVDGGDDLPLQNPAADIARLSATGKPAARAFSMRQLPINRPSTFCLVAASS